MNRDLLIEIGTEDLPARFVRPLSDALAEGIAGGLRDAGVEFGKLTQYATPRRIAVRLESVAPAQLDQYVERRGPAVKAAFRDGEPTRAATGFAESCGVTLEALERVATPKGEWLMFRARQAGKLTSMLIPDLFAATLASMDQMVPKRMRWGDGDDSFVRPVQWLLALWGEDLIPIRAFGLEAGRISYGHRFHAPDPLAISSPAEYERLLRRAHVHADFDARREDIRLQILARAKQLGGDARIDEGLLEEVTALVEWPVVISGHFDASYLDLPPEVLIATVEQHQRYFPLRDASGALMPAFITVSNIESRDEAQVVLGNERVVAPRLSDAMFFWTQDRKQALQEFLPGLDRVTFHKALGSTGDKLRRVVSLASHIAGLLDVERADAERAAQLCKADLQTQMVFEFPELQGLMGAYYARASGESEAVATAIAEHYSPVGAGAAIPASALGRVVALADKLDTLAGIFAVGQAPTGSKDPFALRRAALGVLRILVEAELPVDLQALIGVAVQEQPAGERGDSTGDALWAFMLERLRGVLDVPVEVFNAVAETGSTVPADFARRVDAVRGFQTMPEAAALAAAHKRVRNVLKQADGSAVEVDTSLFELDAEAALHTAITQARSALDKRVQAASYSEALQGLASLRGPVDAYFEQVMVMADDPAVRANRVATLAHLDALCRQVADLSCLPG